MVDDPRIDAEAAAYRGFLFADMRGFTAFAERHGNTAAAEMVGQFLEMARDAIARHRGADVKTEGDAIHAVFSSASSAVLCGLDIVDAAARGDGEAPGRPLGVGVGVHAGEAVETAEGYIGRAVNIAARLCALARPGEVLVSSTVKGIAHASIPVGFIPRGRRRLKGIQDPVVVYAVTRDTAASARSVPRMLHLGAAGLAVAAIAAIAVLAGSPLVTAPREIPTATVGTTAQPLAIGALPIGSYRSSGFQPPITFDIVDQGWTANRDLPAMLGLLRDVSPRGSVYFLRVGEVFRDPCIQGGEGTQTGPAAADLISSLQELPHLSLSNRMQVQVAGLDGQQLDVTISDAALAACGGLVGGDVALFGAGAEVWSGSPGERFRLIAVDGEPALTVVLSTDWTQAPSVRELEELLELGQRILDSVELAAAS